MRSTAPRTSSTQYNCQNIIPGGNIRCTFHFAFHKRQTNVSPSSEHENTSSFRTKKTDIKLIPKLRLSPRSRTC